MLRYTVAALAALLFSVPVLGQEAPKTEPISPENSSAYYYVNIPIEKVYNHRLGYVVMYRKSGTELGQAYLPSDWFTKSAGKGELIRMQSGKNWPYLTVFYKDGQVDHVRLFVRREMYHPSWGILPPGTNIDDRFDSKDLKLEL